MRFFVLKYDGARFSHESWFELICRIRSMICLNSQSDAMSSVYESCVI